MRYEKSSIFFWSCEKQPPLENLGTSQRIVYALSTVGALKGLINTFTKGRKNCHIAAPMDAASDRKWGTLSTQLESLKIPYTKKDIQSTLIFHRVHWELLDERIYEIYCERHWRNWGCILKFMQAMKPHWSRDRAQRGYSCYYLPSWDGYWTDDKTLSSLSLEQNKAAFTNKNYETSDNRYHRNLDTRLRNCPYPKMLMKRQQWQSWQTLEPSKRIP